MHLPNTANFKNIVIATKQRGITSIKRLYEKVLGNKSFHTVRALKYNGGVPKDQLSEENLEALKKGIVNLEKHIENLQKYGVPVVVTLNSFVTDTKAETDYIEQFCRERDCEFALAKVWENGGKGGVELAEKVLKTLETKESHFKPLYADDLSLEEKIDTIANDTYGTDGVT